MLERVVWTLLLVFIILLTLLRYRSWRRFRNFSAQTLWPLGGRGELERESSEFLVLLWFPKGIDTALARLHEKKYMNVEFTRIGDDSLLIRKEAVGIFSDLRPEQVVIRDGED